MRTGGDSHSFSVRLSLFYAALFAVYGIQLPYFPVWLDDRGLTPAEIGLVSAAPLFLRVLIGPAAAFLADRSGDRRRAVVIASAAALAAVLALTQSGGGLALILLLTAVFLVGVQTGGPLGEAIALAGVRDRGVDYGRMRLWGSLSFLVATFAGGWLLGRLGAASVIWMLLAGTAGLLAAAWLLPVPPPDHIEPRERRVPSLTEVAKVASSGSFVLFLIAVGVIQASHAVFYGFGVLHWQSLGIPGGTISLLWSTSILAEIGLFAWGGRFMTALGPIGFILAGGGAAIVRWGAMAFDPPVTLLFPLQVLHALTFGATHLGAMQYIQRAVPHEQAATAQALAAAAAGGVAMGLAMLAAGMLYGPYAGLSYLAMAAAAAPGVAAAIVLRSRGNP